MKYSKSNITGDAGEHLVAAKVIKMFGFPCRLIGIDIGIDAEIEIIDSNFKSTGDFLKCQIKTTQNEDLFVYVKQKHILYWNSINIPVVIFLVHLNSENVYWHCINDTTKYESSGKSIKVVFQAENVLAESNKEAFADLVYSEHFQFIRKVYEEAYLIAFEDLALIENEEYDLTTVEFFVTNLYKIENGLRKVHKLVKKHKILSKIDLEYADKFKTINRFLKEAGKLKEKVEDDDPGYYDFLKDESF